MSLWTHSSPQRTAFSTPTAAVVCLSKPWPMWSAWALVRSSNSISLGSLVLGRYCRFFISLVDLKYIYLQESQQIRDVQVPLKDKCSCFKDRANTPFPFERWFWHVCQRYHLFSRSDPHDGAVVTLCGALQPQTGESSPGQGPLHKHRTRNVGLHNTLQHFTGRS